MDARIEQRVAPWIDQSAWPLWRGWQLMCETNGDASGELNRRFAFVDIVRRYVTCVLWADCASMPDMTLPVQLTELESKLAQKESCLGHWDQALEALGKAAALRISETVAPEFASLVVPAHGDAHAGFLPALKAFTALRNECVHGDGGSVIVPPEVATTKLAESTSSLAQLLEGIRSLVHRPLLYCDRSINVDLGMRRIPLQRVVGRPNRLDLLLPEWLVPDGRLFILSDQGVALCLWPLLDTHFDNFKAMAVGVINRIAADSPGRDAVLGFSWAGSAEFPKVLNPAEAGLAQPSRHLAGTGRIAGVCRPDQVAMLRDLIQPDLVPPAIDGYDVRPPYLGVGGSAVVWQGSENATGDRVAVKVLKGICANDASAKLRLEREINALKDIRCDSLVRCRDGDAWAPRPYLIMDFIEGTSLKARIESSPISQREVESILTRVLDALTALHTHVPAIIHRDVSDTNVLLDSHGLAFVIDLGVVRIDGLRGLTMIEGRVGSERFMAPEQNAGRDVDARTDIFAVGRLLHCMLKKMEAPAPRVNAGLTRVIRRSTHELPANRFATAAEMRVAFVSALEGTGDPFPLNRGDRLDSGLTKVIEIYGEVGDGICLVEAAGSDGDPMLLVVATGADPAERLRNLNVPYVETRNSITDDRLSTFRTVPQQPKQDINALAQRIREDLEAQEHPPLAAAAESRAVRRPRRAGTRRKQWLAAIGVAFAATAAIGWRLHDPRPQPLVENCRKIAMRAQELRSTKDFVPFQLVFNSNGSAISDRDLVSRWVGDANAANILIVAPSDHGKSWLADILADEACTADAAVILRPLAAPDEGELHRLALSGKSPLAWLQPDWQPAEYATVLRYLDGRPLHLVLHGIENLSDAARTDLDKVLERLTKTTGRHLIALTEDGVAPDQMGDRRFDLKLRLPAFNCTKARKYACARLSKIDCVAFLSWAETNALISPEKDGKCPPLLTFGDAQAAVAVWEHRRGGSANDRVPVEEFFATRAAKVAGLGSAANANDVWAWLDAIAEQAYAVPAKPSFTADSCRSLQSAWPTAPAGEAACARLMRSYLFQSTELGATFPLKELLVQRRGQRIVKAAKVSK